MHLILFQRRVTTARLEERLPQQRVHPPAGAGRSGKFNLLPQSVLLDTRDRYDHGDAVCIGEFRSDTGEQASRDIRSPTRSPACGLIKGGKIPTRPRIVRSGRGTNLGGTVRGALLMSSNCWPACSTSTCRFLTSQTRACKWAISATHCAGATETLSKASRMRYMGRGRESTPYDSRPTCPATVQQLSGGVPESDQRGMLACRDRSGDRGVVARHRSDRL